MNSNALFKTINNRLVKDDLCEEVGIELYPTVSGRLNDLRYKMAEFWNREESQQKCIKLFGLYYGCEIYRLLL